MSTTYSRQDLETSIAKLRTLAPRAKWYRTAQLGDPFGEDYWVTGRYQMNADGTDEMDDFDLCEGGLRRFEHIRTCRSEEQAIHRATRDNIRAINRIEHPDEMSPALPGVPDAC
jgi:hypothetical protein